MVNQILPEIDTALLKLFSRVGFNVSFPEAQKCCGKLFHNSRF